jgi:neutral ceramidase
MALQYVGFQRLWMPLGIGILWGFVATAVFGGEFQAGAAAVDVSPRVLPAIRNGGFLEATSDRVDDPLHARCLVLSDGNTTLAITIVDSCMVPRDVCDAIKQRVERDAGIPAERVLIAATHTHSAPSLMDHCLGTRKDPAYAESFIPQVAAGIAKAKQNLAPAEAGWTIVDAPEHTHSRRWLHRADAYQLDPFGEKSVRAMMHPGYQNPAYAGPAGPVDTKLTLLSLRTTAGRPIAILSNYSMHYFGAGAGFSADYFGEYAGYLENKLGREAAEASPLVAIMSQGTSGDLHWMDYAQPMRPSYPRSQYAQELGDLAIAALAGLEYRRDVNLAMAQSELKLGRRLPSPARVKWAEEVRAKQAGERPSTLPEVYAEQAVWLRDNPTANLVLQAVRIGDLGLTAIPNEVYGITGLKLKAQSPLPTSMNLELANGAEGYIPPPEQHFLGGYTTWPARTAGLETEAETKIVASLLDLLEQVTPGKKRRPLTTDLYSDEQRSALEQAREDNNNEQNRGATR